MVTTGGATVQVAPAALEQLALAARGPAGELREAVATVGGRAARVSAQLGVAAGAFDAMGLRWSSALDQVAGALDEHAAAVAAAAGAYRHTDAAAVPAAADAHRRAGGVPAAGWK